MMLSYSLHANDVICLICKLGAKAKLFMQITKTSINYDEETKKSHSYVQFLWLCIILMQAANQVSTYSSKLDH